MRVYTRVTIGQLHLELGRAREALSEIEPEIAQLDGWRKADPEDVIAPIALGATLSLLGESRVRLGEFDAALSTYAEAMQYLKPELGEASADVRIIYGRMLAGLAQAEAGLAMTAQGTDRASRVAASRETAQRAVKILESIANDGDNGREASEVLAAVRPILAAS
jgi:tetratricopeptide (TPR) repeat protein